MYRALVVEDDPISQAALAKVLEKEGFTATVAATLRKPGRSSRRSGRTSS